MEHVRPDGKSKYKLTDLQLIACYFCVFFISCCSLTSLDLVAGEIGFGIRCLNAGRKNHDNEEKAAFKCHSSRYGGCRVSVAQIFN